MTKRIYEKVAQWCEKNPFVVYGGYRDELTEEQICLLLAGKFDSFWESTFKSEIMLQDSDTYAQESAFKEMLEALSLKDTEKTRDAFNESFLWDFSDFWHTCARNSSVHAVAIPLVNGEPIDGPHCDNAEDDNAAIIARLCDLFGMTESESEKLELTYSNEVLKLCGTIDLAAILEAGESGSLNQITIGPEDSDNALFHSSWQGSGNMGAMVINKTVTLPCKILNDDKNRYGVNAVYGLTESFWRHELKLSHK